MVNPRKKAPRLENILLGMNQGINSQDTFPSIEHYDDEILTLSHRYFYLKELLIPEKKIPQLLEKHASDPDFGKLSKTLNNQISLLTYEIAGKDIGYLVTDKIKLDNIHWLVLAKNEIQTWKNQHYHQKKTLILQKKIQEAKYDLKILNHQQRNLFFMGFDLLQQIFQGGKLKSQYRAIKRKYKSLYKKNIRLNNKIKQLSKKTLF